MSIILTEGASSATYAPAPAGTHPAVCVGLIDLGTLESTFEGETKSARKLLLQFEVTDPELRRDDGRPFTVSKRFTQSLHKKAALRAFLEAWRGRPFTPEELAGFDAANLLGVPCLVNVQHTEREGKTFANVASAVKLPRGMAAAQPEEVPLLWSFAAPSWDAFARLSPRLQELIQAAPEFAAIAHQMPRQAAVVAAAPQPVTQPPAPPQAAPQQHDEFADIPF